MAMKSAPRTRRNLAIAVPALLLIALAFVIALPFAQAPPPRTIVIATATKGSPYYQLAVRYGEELARHGIKLDIRETQGSAENLALLKASPPGVDAAILQGGLANANSAPEIESLGRVMYEPVWLFRSGGASVTRIVDLKGKRVLVGPAGSGTSLDALMLLAANGITAENATLINSDLPSYVEALGTGTADAGFLVLGPAATTIKRLFADPRVAIVPIAEADAYAQRFPFLSHVDLKEGIVDFGRNVPPQNTPLLTTTAAVVIRKSIHPALASLLTQVMIAVHTAPSFNADGTVPLLEPMGVFPIRTDRELVMSEAARRAYMTGPTFLERVFPFWIAAMLNGFAVLIIPTLGVLVPVSRVAPALYKWHSRRRILRWYKQLKLVESDITSDISAAEVERKQARIDEIETTINEMAVPLGYANMLYDLRQHIEVVRRRLAVAARQVGPHAVKT